MIRRNWVITVAMAAAVVVCAQDAFARAHVFEFLPGIAQVNANSIAQNAFTPTPGEIDKLYAPTFPGDGVCAPNGAFVEAKDVEASLGFTNHYSCRASYNKCTDGPARNKTVATFAKGIGSNDAPSRGFGVAAIGDTAVADSFQVQINPVNATNANVVVNGEIVIQRNVASPGVGRFDILVYPDSTIANLDPARTGAGAVFKGRLIVDRDGIEKADGNWSAGDFQVQVTADRVRVRAVNLTKAFTAPNTAVLASDVNAEASAVAVPASSPVAIGALSLLLLGGGYMFLRRRRLEA
jgi:hypothetical protein